MSVYYKRDKLSIISAVVYMAAFGGGLGCSMYAYIPEILPPAGVGLVSMFRWLVITGVSKLIPLLIDKYTLNWTINFFLSKWFSVFLKQFLRCYN